MLKWSKGKAEPGKAVPTRKSAAPEEAVPVERPTAATKGPEAPRTQLGDILLEAGSITEEQMSQARQLQQKNGMFLGQILVDLGFISDDSLTSFLAKHCKLPHLSLLDYLIDTKLLEYVPQETCQRYKILPIDKMGRNLTVAMVNPLDGEALKTVQALCPDLRIKPILCAYSHYEKVTARLFDEEAKKKDGNSSELTAESFGLSASVPAPKEAAKPAPKATPAEPKHEPTFDEDGAVEAVFQKSEDVASENEAAAVSRGAGGGNAAEVMEEMVAVMRESMTETYAMLCRRMELFRGLAPETVAKIFTRGVTVEFGANEKVFEKGESGAELYVILSGGIDIRDGDKTLAKLGKGDAFGEMGWFSHEPRSADAVSTEDTSLLALSEEILDSLIPRDAAMQLLINLVVMLSARLRAANE